MSQSIRIHPAVVARPFDEPSLLKIASPCEAATHRRQPPSDFDPLAGEP